MEFFNQFVIPPNAGHLTLLRYLLILTQLVVIPYLALVFGCTLVSLALNNLDRDRKVATGPSFGRLASDLMNIAIPGRTQAIVLGVLPLAALWMIYGQWLYQSATNTMNLLATGGVIIALSFVPIFGYKETLTGHGQNSQKNVALGALGLAAFVLGTYIFIGSAVRFQDPERWIMTHDPVRTLTSFNIIWKYLFFAASGIALTGCSVLYFFFEWAGSKPAMDDEYRLWSKNFATGLAMKGILALPLLGFFYMVTTPILAMSTTVYRVAAASLVLMFATFVLLVLNVGRGRPRFGRTSFMLLIAVFLLVGVCDQMTLVNATKEHSAALTTAAAELAAQRALEREALHGGGEVNPAEGERIFKEVCMTCHRMDERLVGPPLNTVLPKYAGNAEALVAFIQKPSKKNPDYPPMPAPALKLGEIRSVAAYLLGQTGSSEGTPDTTGTGENH